MGKADTFGKSDPYAIVEFAGRVVGKTRYISSTLNPEWNESKFVIWVSPDITESENLVVKVFDRDMVGSHEFLGLSVVAGEHLLGEENIESFGKISKKTLRPDSSVVLKDYNKLVKGHIEMGFAADDNASAADNFFDGDDVARLREGEIGLRMNIMSASGLGKADMFGKSDPFVVVRVDGEGWYESKAVDDTMDPIWGNETTVFPLNRVSKEEEEAKRKAKQEAAAEKERQLLLSEVAAKKGLPAPKSPAASILRRSSYTEEGGAEDPPPVIRKTSSVTFTGTEAKPQSENLDKKVRDDSDEDEEDSSDKEEKMRKKEAEAGEEEKKESDSAAAPRGTDDDDDSDDLDDLPEGAPPNFGKEKLILEVWDMDIAGKGGFLGRIGIERDKLDDPDFYNKPQTFPLGRCPELPQSHMKAVKEGSTVTVRFTPTDYEAERHPKKKMFLNVIEAWGLAKADRFGNSDPFAVIKINKKTVLKTKVVNDVVTPLWDERVAIELPRNELDFTEIEIDVYDADALSFGDFLGMIKLDAKDLLDLRSGTIEVRRASEMQKTTNTVLTSYIQIHLPVAVRAPASGRARQEQEQAGSGKHPSRLHRLRRGREPRVA